MSWLLHVLQSLNPFVGITGAVPIGIGVLRLPVLAASLIPVGGTLVQLLSLHWGWCWMQRRPRLRGFLERRRLPWLRAFIERRGLYLTVFLVTFVAGTLPTYISMRFLGIPFERITGLVMALAASANSASILGLCALAGIA